MEFAKHSDTELSLTNTTTTVTTISKDSIVEEMRINRYNLERSNVAHNVEVELFNTRYFELQSLLDKCNELGLKTASEIAAQQLEEQQSSQENIE